MRIGTIKKLNEEFCKNALEVGKNLSIRDVHKKFKLCDLEPIDYGIDRVDRNLFCENGDFIFYLDVENHKTKSLKEMIKSSYEIAKIVDSGFPKQFSTKFSGRGFHMCTLIKNNVKIIKFLKENKIETIYDFCKGVAYGIASHLKISFDWFDTQQMNKNGMIRGFCVNNKAILNDKIMYSVPINLQNDDLNSIINKSLLLKDFNDEFVLPEFDLFDFYKSIPMENERMEKRLLILNLKDAIVPLYIDTKMFAICIQKLIEKGKKEVLGNKERYILISVLLQIPYPPVDVMRFFRQYLILETFDKMWRENQIAQVYHGNKVAGCKFIKNNKCCVEGCISNKPYVLNEKPKRFI